jgi:hypothetical protein
MFNHLVKMNNQRKKAHLWSVRHLPAAQQKAYLISQLNCCGLWYGNYHGNEPHRADSMPENPTFTVSVDPVIEKEVVDVV